MINLLLNRYCVVRDIFKLTRGGLLESNDNRVKQQSFVTPCEQKQHLFCWQTTNYSFRCLFILKLYLLISISQLKLKLKLNRNIWNIFRSYLYKNTTILLPLQPGVAADWFQKNFQNVRQNFAKTGSAAVQMSVCSSVTLQERVISQIQDHLDPNHLQLAVLPDPAHRRWG